MRHTIILSVLAAALAAPALAEDLAVRENAPDRYVVKPGDTLWSISGRFLKQPWRWAEIWGLNKDQIKNAHRIYPGDVIVLERRGPSLALRPTVKVGPQVHYEAHEREAVPAIPRKDIEPFLSKPLVVSESELDSAPEIFAGAAERVILGGGDAAYVRGMPADSPDTWNIYRRGKELRDPDSGELLGYEAIYLGEARVVERAETSTVKITRSAQEIYRGDRLVPAPDSAFVEYVPHAPDNAVRGRVIGVYGGVAEGGRNSVITIDRGEADGLERGHVLALYRGGHVIESDPRAKPQHKYPFIGGGCLKPGKQISWGTPYDPDDVFGPCPDDPGAQTLPRTGEGCVQPDKQATFDKPYDPKEVMGPCPGPESLPRLPEQRFGIAMVFRTFDRVSYALIMESSGPIKVLDLVRQP